MQQLELDNILNGSENALTDRQTDRQPQKAQSVKGATHSQLGGHIQRRKVFFIKPCGGSASRSARTSRPRMGLHID